MGAIPLPQTRGRAGARRPARRWLRWVVIPLLLIVLAGGISWWFLSRRQTTPTITTGTVTQGDIATTVNGSGSVAAARTVDVPLQQAGTITAVSVKVGDQAKAGQTLVQLDTTDLQLALQEAQANLTSAQAALKAAQGGSATPEDITSAQAALTSAKAQLQQTKTGTATAADIKSAQAALESAQAKLDALKNPTQAALSAAQTTLNQAQTNLQTQKDSLSAAKTSAYNSMQQAVNSLTEAQTSYSKAKTDWEYVQANGADPANPTTTGTNGKAEKNKLSDSQKQQYYNTYVQSEASMHSAETAVQQAQLNYESAQKSEAAQVPELEQVVANAQTQLDALKNPSANDLKQAQAAVTQAQANLTNLKQGGTAAAIAQSQAAVTQAQANLDALTAPKSDADIASAEANVTQAQVAVNTAQSNLDEATLKAPFAGVVSAVSVVQGSTVSANTAAVTLVDNSTLHIDVSLSESDAAKVQATQPVTLTFDALPDVILKGTVATVAPTSTTSQNVVTYLVQVTFDPGKTAVKVGMSATAEIQVDKATGVLLVPSRAITTSGTTKTVTVLQGDTPQNGQQPTQVKIPVKTGLTNNGLTQITSSGGNGVSALKSGDKLVLPSTTTSSSSTSSTSSRNTTRSILSGGSGGPPAGGPPAGP